MSAAEKLDSMGHEVSVVSMPSTDVFDSQDASWKEHVLPRNVRVRLSIEAGVTDGWIKYVGLDGRAFGLDTFGESGPADEVFEYFGFNLDNVVTAVTDLLN
jgi:transketolase